MKNLDMLKYLQDAEKAAYNRMNVPAVFPEGYEYHRGKYDALAYLRKDREVWLKGDAKVMNLRLDDMRSCLEQTRKWTILPRNRKRIDFVLRTLEKLREPITAQP